MSAPVAGRPGPLVIAALAVMSASIAGQVLGAQQNAAGYSTFAAAAFTGAILRVAWQLNKPWWHSAGEIGPANADAQPMLARRNAGLIALGYAWGGMSLLAVYLLSPLKWQHGWQYGSGMVLIALLLYLAARRISNNWGPSLERTLSYFCLVHGWAATAGLAWLIGSGKWLSVKGDWAANVVFICGAITIVGISAIALRTNRMLAPQR